MTQGHADVLSIGGGWLATSVVGTDEAAAFNALRIAGTRFMVGVSIPSGAALELPDVSDMTFDVGVDAQTFTLPEGTGGVAPLVYTLAFQNGNALPTGVSLTGRDVHITTLAVPAVLALRATVTDAASETATSDFSLTLRNPPITLPQPNDRQYRLGVAGSFSLHPAQGGLPPVGYGSAGHPLGLTFSLTNTFPTYSVGRRSHPTRCSAPTRSPRPPGTPPFRSRPPPAPSTSSTFANLVFAIYSDQGSDIHDPVDHTFGPATGGEGVIAYEISGLPDGLTAAGLRVTGTTTAAAVTSTVTIRATDSAGGTWNVASDAYRETTITWEIINTRPTLQPPPIEDIYVEFGTPLVQELPISFEGSGTLVYTLTNVDGTPITGGLGLPPEREPSGAAHPWQRHVHHPRPDLHGHGRGWAVRQ